MTRRRIARRCRLRALAPPLALICALSVALLSTPAYAAEGPTFKPEFSCKSVTYRFEGFPNAPNNTVTEKITIDGKAFSYTKFHFNGESGENTVSITVPPGKHSIDARASWNTNGVRGARDIPKHGGLTCEADPGFAILKEQRLAGSKTKYSPAVIPIGHVGQLVEYAILATNSGNVPLTFSEFSDPRCDEGTLSGGPSGPIAPGERTIYFCTHTLTSADGNAGKVQNEATVTGTPGEGAPQTKTSNAVIVELPTKPTGTNEFSCNSVTYSFSGFPNVPANSVFEKITLDGKTVYTGTFTFDGSSGANTIHITIGPGHHTLDAHAAWKTHGFKGAFDHKKVGGINCSSQPAFTIEKRQEIAGSSGGFTTAKLTGKVNQTVDYEILVVNTGNVALTLGPLADEKCDPGTIVGPGENPLAPGKGTSFTCNHMLGVADLAAGSYTNAASETATPPEGPALTHESNTVVVEVQQ
jgi:hypothetical protein